MPSQHFETILAGALLSFVLTAAAPLEAQRPKSERKWTRSTLADLSLREKAAQMVMVRSFGRYSHPRSDSYRDLLAQVRDLGVGGLVIFDSDLESIPRLLDELQQAAEIPLLVAVDSERGMSFRVRRGTVSLPYAMAIGATGSADAARFAGEVTAREGRALGIHWTLAPVADVNNNPANPIINIRSFGEDPELVGRMVRAFIAGARGEGQLTTAKHFPGHGDTAIDSHVALPTLAVDRVRLDAVELAPFRAAIDAGVDTVMLGHIAVPALDPSGAPATLSKAIATDLLRGELGFRGLIVTDALEMDGLAAWTGAAAVQSVQAGADVLLLPADPRVAVRSLVRAVEEGEISEARLDASVKRILEAKARLGLHRQRRVDPGAVDREVARPEDVAKALEIAADSITVVRNDGGILPLRAEEPLRLLHLVISSDLYDIARRRFSAAEIAARRVDVETRYLGPEVAVETIDELVTAAAESSHVVVSAFARTASSEGRSELSLSQLQLLRRLHGSGRPVILISFGSPYLLTRISEIPAYVCAYGAAEASQRAAIAVLFGETDAGGRLPVALPGLFDAGHGLEIRRRHMTLRISRPQEAGFRADGFAEVDRLLGGFLEQRAFPGGVLAVGHRGALVHLRPFGRLSYDDGAAAVTAGTLYDLASLTKVIATTTMAMILVDEERLDLDSPVQDFLPRFRGAGKEAVTVRHLLTHSSGIDWWAPLYEELAGKTAYVEKIQAMELVYEPGTKSLYSDLGLILLGEILERVAAEPLDEFVLRRIFEPLGMVNTRFRPGTESVEHIAPTEDDPWRGRMLRGEVHDENAFALGGVAPHAGLFGTAGDLARFAQMILYGGVFEHRRIVSRATVESFIRRAGVPESTRALGWDTKSPEKSSAGTLFSPRSFGHTGFTGTSLWIDPDRELFVILLTNRVHPTRENKLIRQVRPAVADAVVRGLTKPTAEVVKVGLERLSVDAGRSLQGKRLGLIVHAASVTADGRHAIDVLRDRDLEVVSLFTPEHGLRGRAAAGEKVDSGVDEASGLPVVSLYGERRRPQPEDLEGLDALVFDLQGPGVRFYTYVSTLILCLEAAADAGLEFVVLDRPNPLGGERIEGPVAAPRDIVPESFVNLAPGPLVHGLTVGEMARYVNARLAKPARLTVVRMDGWTRQMTWAGTARPWVAPSPNLRTADAALAYPGTALLESTNVSEGRGTPSPFLLLGAPWLTAAVLQTLIAEVRAPGFELSATRFTPLSSPAAPRPKYLGEECNGLRVEITDPAKAQPYRLGLELLRTLARQPAFKWTRDGDALTWLLGTANVFRDLKEGKTVGEILAADAEDHAAWRRDRRPALLY